MSDTLGLACRDLGTELYEIICGLDPARWRAELMPAARQRLEALAVRAREMAAQFDRPHIEASSAELISGLQQFARTAEAVVRDAQDHRPDWAAARERLNATYDRLSKAMRERSLRLPRNRPTNYARNIYHAGSSAFGVWMIQHVLDRRSMIFVAVGLVAFGWIAELTRRHSRSVNRALTLAWKPVMHPDEHWKINSATWFVSALLLLAVCVEPLAATLALGVAGVGDPFAAIVGRKWGRHRIHGTKTLEGSLAFVAISAVATGALLSAYGPAVGWVAVCAVALATAIPAALAELYSGRIDDNFLVPVVAGVGATLSLAAFAL